MEELEAPWRALEVRAASPVFFQSWAWTRHVLLTAQTYGGKNPIEICVVAAWDGPSLVAVWPLFDQYAARSGRDLRVFRLSRVG